MLEYRVISPNRLPLTLEDAKRYLLRDQDPFLSFVRPVGQCTDDLDKEFLALKRSYRDQKRSGAITSIHQKKTDLFPLKSAKRIPVLVASVELENPVSTYRLPNFIKIPQKLNDPIIVSWLQSDFEVDHQSSVPRSLMYEAYAQFCRTNLHCITNQACFGKSVRGVFPNLQTRRIGVRGNSKYHYFGLRVKPGTTTADYFAKKQHSVHKSKKSVKRAMKVESFTQQVKPDSAETLKDDPVAKHLRELINILIPEFPTLETLNVSGDVFKEAEALLRCYETYAVEILRAAMKATEKNDFQQVFEATQAFWKALRLVINDDTTFCHPDILGIMSLCDSKIQIAIREIILPDLFAAVPDDKLTSLETLFNGIYLSEMMGATEQAPNEVQRLKKHVYKTFSSEMLDLLHFTKLLKKVEQQFENLPVSRILQRAVLNLNLDYILSKCQFAFAMKKSSFISTEKQLRQGLSAFHASLYNCFHLRGFLDWVKSCVLNQIKTDIQNSRQKDRVALTLLCFSYAVSLLFSELEKHIPLQLHNGLRNTQLLLTDYICFAVKDELQTHIPSYQKQKLLKHGSL